MAEELFLRLAAAGPPEVSRPDPATVIAGDPVHRTWNLEARGALSAGIWESTPGIWRIAYEEWEYCRILSGISVITDAAGRAQRVGPGDSFLLRPGFAGTWEVVETTRKDYVILA